MSGKAQQNCPRPATEEDGMSAMQIIDPARWGENRQGEGAGEGGGEGGGARSPALPLILFLSF